MPLNLELKIKLQSHTKLLNALKRINAEKKGVLKQKDVYYKTGKGLLSFVLKEMLTL